MTARGDYAMLSASLNILPSRDDTVDQLQNLRARKGNPMKPRDEVQSQPQSQHEYKQPHAYFEEVREGLHARDEI